MKIIKTILKEQGRSQVWLARRINVNPITVYHWTAERRKIPVKFKPLIAQLLGFPENILFPDGKT